MIPSKEKPFNIGFTRKGPKAGDPLESFRAHSPRRLFAIHRQPAAMIIIDYAVFTLYIFSDLIEGLRSPHERPLKKN